MAKRVTLETLGAAIQEELTIYHRDVIERVDALSKKAASDLAKKTRATAPVGARGSFKRNISSKLLKKNRNGSTYVWYVKPPDHRLTHLLVHGHATRNGGRTRGNSFLSDAWAQVQVDYEEAIKEALQNGK